jgi:hypothetical protein
MYVSCRSFQEPASAWGDPSKLKVNDVVGRRKSWGVNEDSIRTIGTRIQSILRINFFSSMGDRGGYLVVACAMYIAA